MKRSLVFLLAMSFLLISCEKRDAVTNTHNQREGLQVYTNPELTRQFKEGLEREGVPFSTSIREGLEYIHWAPEHDSRVTIIKNRLFGEQPPIDRSICMGKTQIAELQKWLKLVQHRFCNFAPDLCAARR
jgi:hypothetical protein